MLNNIIKSIFSGSILQLNVTIGEYLLCLGVALVLGLLISVCSKYRSKQSRSLSIALVLLPMVIQTIIMLVNREFGTGLAVAGAFGLIRFRSVPASARDIATLALAIAVGLALGMGCVGIAIILTVVVLAVGFILVTVNFGRAPSGERQLRIVIPEGLNYSEVFNDVFREYTTQSELIRVKTTNMGSLFHLQYEITLRDPRREKEFIDELRIRNGNLEIVCTKPDSGVNEI